MKVHVYDLAITAKVVHDGTTLPEGPQPRSFDVPFDETAPEKAWKMFERARVENLQPRAFVCGLRAFLSLLCHVFDTTTKPALGDRRQFALPAGHGTATSTFLGLPLQFVPGMRDDDMLLSFGADAVGTRYTRDTWRARDWWNV